MRSPKALNLDAPISAAVKIENPFARFGEALSSVALRPLVLPTFPLRLSLQGEMEKFQRTIREISESVERSLAPLKALSRQVAKYDRIAEALERAGWLPHDLIPIDLVEQHVEAEPATLSTAVEQYFECDWASVERLLRERYASAGIDSETAAAMDEAFRAHSSKLYRASCRTVFPEIERVAREKFYNGREKGITSLPELRKAVLGLPVNELRPRGLWGFRLFEAINEACYAKVTAYLASTADAAARVPNRHAVAHGLLPYTAARDSLNTFFIADFLFEAVAALERAASEREP